MQVSHQTSLFRLESPTETFRPGSDLYLAPPGHASPPQKSFRLAPVGPGPGGGSGTASPSQLPLGAPAHVHGRRRHPRGPRGLAPGALGAPVRSSPGRDHRDAVAHVVRGR